jgi:hypothetical protein
MTDPRAQPPEALADISDWLHEEQIFVPASITRKLFDHAAYLAERLAEAEELWQASVSAGGGAAGLYNQVRAQLERERAAHAATLAEHEGREAELRDALERYVEIDAECAGCCVNAGPEHANCGLCRFCGGTLALSHAQAPADPRDHPSLDPFSCDVCGQPAKIGLRKNAGARLRRWCYDCFPEVERDV